MTDAATSQRTCKTLMAAGDFAGARAEVDRAMRAWPGMHQFPWLSARLFHHENQPAKAFAEVQKAIDLDPDQPVYWQTFCLELLQHIDSPPPGLVEKIGRAMAIGGIANRNAFKAAHAILNRVLAPQPSQVLPLLRDLETRGDPVFGLALAFLAHGRTIWIPLEEAFTSLRRALLAGLESETADAGMGRLIAALAIHCFNNEFVFADSDMERAAVARLRERLHDAPDLTQALMLGAYAPIMDEPFASGLIARHGQGTALPARALEVLISQPLRERELAGTVARATPITDETSREVRAQYEQNPYPRWQHLRLGLRDAPAAPSSPRRILIAGCGTGQQPLESAVTSPGDEFWALDLSLASLGYAMRKAEEFGIKNVKFFHGDILELDALGVTFDAIACGGVLHHMASPARGLAALRRHLADDGLLKIMVYTESGRREVVAGIALREHHALPGTPEGIRQFRALVKGLSPEHPAATLRDVVDFYSMSECRDLAFHVMEHRYTLPVLGAMIADAGLKLARVAAPARALKCFRKMFPGPEIDPNLNLDLWARVEERYPGVFGSMYGLHLAKA